MSRHYLLLRKALERFEEARQSRRKIYVSRIAAKYSKSRGGGTEAGRALHRGLWGDPFDTLKYPIFYTPLPVAWYFRDTWLIGIVDLVGFREGLPREVIEYKSTSPSISGIIQASLYGILVKLNFLVNPYVYVKYKRRTIEIKNWEIIALEALSGSL